MPRRRAKPFIAKDEAEHFVMMHRSQQDPKFYEDGATKFVLMSTKAKLPAPSVYAVRGVGGAIERDGDDDEGEGDDSRTHMTGRKSVKSHATMKAGRDGGGGRFTEGMYDRASVAGGRGGVGVMVKTVVARGGGGDAASVRSSRTGAGGGGRAIREVTELDEDGFLMDGYEYSRHLKPMGEGVFISAAGAQAAAGVHLTRTIAQQLDMPLDVLPSKPEDDLDRMLEAITLHEASLPPDLLRAMEEVEAEVVPTGTLSLDDMLRTIVEDEDEEGAGDDDTHAVPGHHGIHAPTGGARETKDDDGGIEALEDQFVLQAVGELPIPGGEGEGGDDGAGHDAERSGGGGDGGGFDFDAHIAKLMAQAEGKWTDTAHDFDDEEEGEEEGEGEEGEEGGGGVGGAGRHAVYPHRPGDDSDRLAVLMAQYDDDLIGELDDDDPRLRQGLKGGMKHRPVRDEVEDDDDDDEEDEEEDEEEDDGRSASPPAPPPTRATVQAGDDALMRMMQEYLQKREQERRDLGWLGGSRGRKGRRREAKAAPPAAGEGGSVGDASHDEDAPATTVAPSTAVPACHDTSAPAPTTAGFAIRLAGRVVAPAAAPSTTATTAAAPADVDREVPYGLGEGDGEESEEEEAAALASWLPTPKEKRWDVETIISTFTNTENRPKPLADGVSITSSHMGFGPKALASVATGASGGTGAAATGTLFTGYGGAPVIRLSKKTGLPVGTAISGKVAQARAAARAAASTAMPTLAEDAPAPAHAAGSVGFTGSHSSKGHASGDEDGDDEDGGSEVDARGGHARDKEETAEEKRARKAAVKAERRSKREAKKVLKGAYKAEELRQSRLHHKRDLLASGVELM